MNARFYKTKRNHHQQQLELAQKALDSAKSDEKEEYQKQVDHHEREYANYAKAYQRCLLG